MPAEIDPVVRDHVGSVFTDGLEDFISESRFAWGQRRELQDRPWRSRARRSSRSQVLIDPFRRRFCLSGELGPVCTQPPARRFR